MSYLAALKGVCSLDKSFVIEEQEWNLHLIVWFTL